jgi:hypothetical protein
MGINMRQPYKDDCLRWISRNRTKNKKKKTEQKAKNGPRRKDMVDTWDLER